MHERVLVLPLRNGWNAEAFSLVTNNYLTHVGLHAYWTAVDSTIKFADTKVMRNFGLKLCQMFQKDKIQSEAESNLAKFELKMNKRRDFREQIQSRQVRNFFERRAPLVPLENRQAQCTSTNQQERRIEEPRNNAQDQPDSTSGDGSTTRQQNGPHNFQGRFQHRRRQRPYSVCRKQLFRDKN